MVRPSPLHVTRIDDPGQPRKSLIPRNRLPGETDDERAERERAAQDVRDAA
jgi:hypothetical protein